MKKITYRELLNMIKEKTNPEVVCCKENVFKWNGTSYLNNRSEYLAEILSEEATDSGLTNIRYISYADKILDEKEKEYLSNLIKPFRNRITTIERRKNKEWERIVIYYKDYDDTDYTSGFMSLPMFEMGTMYTGMKLEQAYTLEELEL